jgi:two-component system response regulator NreC
MGNGQRRTMNKKTNNSPLNQLSAREREIFKLVAEGYTSDEIAGIVGVKLSSVYTYRSRVMAKLESESVADLVRLAIRHHVINP